jgi:amino acid adenylation domain-containing protein
VTATPTDRHEELDPGTSEGEVFVLPASFAQERHWVVEELEPGRPTYNVPLNFRLTGVLDTSALEAAFSYLFERHETLRTVFDAPDGQAMQVILPPAPVVIPVVDLRGLPVAEREDAARAEIQREGNRPFDLRAGPLLRASLVQLDDTEHLLLLTMHHIAVDGWSLGVLQRELGAAYTAFTAGSAPELAPLPIQYADFAGWQHERLAEGALTEQLDYWRRELAAPLPVLELSTDQPRLATRARTAATVSVEVPADVTDALVALGRQAGVTPFVTLLAAFQLLLHRYTGQDDIIVGSPVAGRTRRETEGLIGLFINMLALRTRFEAHGADEAGETATGFRALLAQVKGTVHGALARQDLPFERIVEAVQPERDRTRNPVFQALFAFQDFAPATPLALGDLAVGRVGGARATAKFDLQLIMNQRPGGFRGTLEYDSSLFDEATAQRMITHFGTLLREIATAPDRDVDTLPLLDDAERDVVLRKWNDTFVDYPRDISLVQLLAEQAARTPDAIALSDEHRRVTYAELDAAAAALAHRLRRAGAATGTLVGICAERSIELVVALLGVLKSGAAYVPLDPEYPTERLAFMLKDAAVSVLLAQQHLVDTLPALAGCTAPLVLLDDALAVLVDAAAPASLPLPAATDAAYMIYTSGSTGRPKGAIIPHRAIVNYTSWMRDAFPLTTADSVLQKTPAGFDASVWEFYVPLASGARLVMAPPGVDRNPLDLMAWIDRERITTIQMVPSLLRAMLDTEGFARCTTLRRLFSGGEALTPDLIPRLQGTLDVELHNLYGPTECTVYATHWPCPPSADFVALVPIGKPIANTQIYILDAQQQPVPIGVQGELYVAGTQVGIGYHRRPELTAEKFVADPFSSLPDARMYRTGDLARWRSDGTIEYLGRIDDQVKLRGIRIELGEVEIALVGLPGVVAGAVAIHPDGRGGVRLIGYVVPEPGRPFSSPAMREALSLVLPPAAVPNLLIEMETLPLTPSGKINRRALPAPADSSSDRPYDPPRTIVEHQLAQIWESLLTTRAVGVHDDFFELGGHSLLAMRIMSRVQETFDLRLPLTAVFDRPTVARLGELIEQRLDERTGSTDGGGEQRIAPAVRNVRRGLADVLPASFAQERHWVVEELEPGRPTYNVPLNFRLTGALDYPALEAAFTYLGERHETLRTVFDAPDGRTVQVILPAVRVDIPVVDLRAVPDAEREGAARRVVQEEGNRPFDLRTGPVIRAALVQLADDEHLLLLTLHHIAVDGWSLGVLQRELGVAYTALAAGQAPMLAPLPIQYADVAAWQHERLAEGALTEQLDYWRRELAAPLPVLELSTDQPRLATRARTAATVPLVVPADVTDALLALGRQAGVTPFVTLLAAFQLLLHRYTGQDDIIVGSPVAGRTRRETEGLIGLFINMLALRTRFEAHGSDDAGETATGFRALLAQVKGTVHGALARQDLPFERIVEAVQPERDRTRNPIFQAVFQFRDFAPPAPLTLGNLSVGRSLGARVTAKFDLQLTLNQRPDGFRGALEYDESLYDRETAERMVAHFITLLGEIARAPDQDVDTLTLLSPDERKRVVEEWNQTTTEYPRDAFVHELFAAEAARRPDAVAVTFGDTSLTYAGLDAAADALAGRLGVMGVRPGDRVALFAERSLAMIVATVGILKAGAAYLPLEPGYPADRLGFMLGDAGAHVVLAQQHLASQLADVLDAAMAVSTTGAMLQPRVLRMDASGAIEGDDATGREPDDRPASIGTLAESSAERAAYVMYTSGSTGRPKGVVVPHRAIVRLVRNTNYARLGDGEVLLGFAPTAFDASTFEIWGALLNGGRLSLVPPGLPDLSTLGQLVESTGVTTLFLTTALFQQIVDAGLERYRAVRQLYTGGQVLSIPHIRRAIAELPGCRVNNIYGPTENTTFTSWQPLPDGWHTELPIPIGTPIANTRVHVLDANGQPSPIGVPGELYTGGDGVALGYLGRPELTAERFVRDPFSADPSARLYRTGDRVRWLASGVIEFLGRLDQQVKVRGFRVEPGEIEAALAAHPAVREAAVVARKMEEGETQLIGYYVAHAAVSGANTGVATMPLTSASLRTYLRERLPEYMVPSALVPLDEMPVSATGKVDRGALPAPSAVDDEPRLYTPPRTMVEHQLAQIWTGLLGIAQVGVREDFFELGGHSLLALRMFAEIEKLTGRRLPLAALFEGATIEHLATRIESVVYDEAEPPVVVLQGEGTATPFVMIHGDVRGGGWYCRRLAPLLGADVPLIVLPTLRPGDAGGPETVEGMAAQHVRTLRSVQPSGPYRIGGYCAGGMIAFEMARQLEANGDRVERLVLIDAVAGNARFRRLAPLIDAASRAPTEAQRLERRSALLTRLRYYSGRLRRVRQQGASAQVNWVLTNIRRRLTGAQKAANLPQVAPGTHRRSEEEFNARPGTDLLLFQGRAAGAYIPAAYDGAIDLIVSVEPTGQVSKELSAAMGAGAAAPELHTGRRGWERVSPLVRVHPILNSHLGLITDGLPVLAEHVRACLQRDDANR